MSDLIVSDEPGGVMVVTLNRPDRLNALSVAIRDELKALWASRRDDANLRCVVLTGAGRAFCVGADVDDLSSGTTPALGQRAATALSFLPARVLDAPVIVAVNGLCVGGGLQFIADADIAIASETAWFSDPHITMGQVSAIEPLRLLAKAPARGVVQLMLTGAPYRMTAEQARASQLVTEVLPAGDLLARALELASMIAAQSPTALRTSLRFAREYLARGLEPDLDRAWAAVEKQWSHPDAAEGPRAFVEKRAAKWAPAASDESQAPAQPEARLDAIEAQAAAHRLEVRYAAAVDAQDLLALREMFEEDARLILPVAEYTGRDQIAAFFERIFERARSRDERRQHFITGVVAHPVGNNALEVECGYLYRSDRTGGTPEGGGRYRDLVRLAGGVASFAVKRIIE